MHTIFKYPIHTVDSQTLYLPEGAQPLCVQMQGGQPQLWALVDPNRQSQPVTIRVIGTGHPIPDADRLNYFGTYQLQGGTFIFHVFIVRAEGFARPS